MRRALRGEFDAMELPGLLAATADGDRLAVNDVSFHRRQDGRVAELAYSVEGEQLGEVRCDGLVVVHPGRVDGLQPRQRRPGAGVGRGGLRRLVHRAAHAHRAGAGGGARRHARGDQPLALRGGRRDHRRPPGLRARAARRRCGSSSSSASRCWPRRPGASFYHRLRDKFGRLSLLERHDVGPLRRGPLVSLPGAPRAPHREPAADRARRAAPRARACPRSPARPARARPCWPTRSTSCSGGKARSGIVRPGAREAYVEGVFALPPGLLDEPELAELRGAHRRVARRDRPGPPGERRGPHARVRRGPLGHGGRPAGARRPAGRLLRPARAPAADARLGAARPARRLLRPRPAGAARSAGGRPRARAGARAASWPSCASAPARATATSTCSRSRSRRSRRSSPPRRSARRSPASASACARWTACWPPRAAGRRRSRPSTRRRRRGRSCWPSASSWPAAVQGVDPQLDELAGRLAALRIEAEDLGGELRRYADSLEAEPGRLQEVEERLEQYDRLERKHGGSVAAVLEHAERCRAERERLEQAEVATERAEAELATRAGRAGRAGGASWAPRAREAAPRLAERVREELAALAMEDASFEVRLEPREEIGPSGAERAELMLAPNPGRAGGADPRGGLGRRAVAGDAGADDRGRHGRVAHARVRRGRRRRGRPDRAGGGRAAAGARRVAPGALHHPPAADRGAGERPLPDREVGGRRDRRSPPSRRSTATAWWRS